MQYPPYIHNLILYAQSFLIKYIISYIVKFIMNRKNQEKQNSDQTPQQNAPQTILPKFIANWSTVVRFDRIVINVSDCEYQVVPKVAKELKWKVKDDQTNPQWDVWWTDWAVTPETLMKMEHHQKINHFPGMYTLSRKNLLAKNLMKMRKKCPEQYNYFPLTWNLPSDYAQFKAYYQTKPKGKARTYIVKPQSLSQGKGIYLTRKIQQINPNNHCVVQRYLSKPYLIEGLKFDLRIYVLVAGVDPLRVFIFRDGLARFATETYVAPNKQNMQTVCMHLTNYAINKQSQKFVFNQNQNDMGVGHKRNLEAVFKIMRQRGVDVDKLWIDIQDVIVKTLISGLSFLKFQYRSCQPQNYRGDMCYELLGFDIIINEQLQPILLEINYTPSFSTDTPLDWNIKRSLIKDALVIMGINKQFKQTTVKIRKQYRDQRMMTGKKIKLTLQQKQEKRKTALKQRDQFMAANLGGFTKIYPLDPSNPKQAVYQKLIQFQDDTIVNQSRKLKAEPPIQRRNTQKVNKLPIITKQNTQLKQIKQFKRTAFSRKIADISKSSKQVNQDQYNTQQQRLSQPTRQLSQKLLKKMKAVREVSINVKRKSYQTRETLVPKTIQFQANFDFQKGKNQMRRQ